MNWHLALAAAASLIAFSSMVPYVRDIFHGTTRPNTITWLLWLFIQIIAISAQFYEGASWSVIFVIADGINIVIVLAISLGGYGYRAWNAFDVGCGALGVVAIIAWQATGDGVLALIFAVAADSLAALPTLRKSFQDPWSENPEGWALTALAAGLGVAATAQYNVANLLFPSYLFLINFLTFALAFVGRRTHSKPVEVR
jgi:hypothetical protein